MEVVRVPDRRTTWSIETETSLSDTFEVQYGIVPDGFRQRVPKAGVPPELETGTRYRVFVYGPPGRAEFVYKGAIANPPCQLGPETK